MESDIDFPNKLEGVKDAKGSDIYNGLSMQ
jgi:hypothetical protein